MEYFRTENGQIYADIAYRLGKIVIQYEKLKVPANEEKFEATLYMAVLQNLLTISNEYVRTMIDALKKQEKQDSHFRKDVDLCQDFEANEWGLRKGCWVENKFNEKINLQNFIERMRNSVSHPTDIDYYNPFTSTGYTTLDNDNTTIKKFGFVNSPDTTNNRIKYYSSRERVEDFIEQCW